MIPIGDGVIRDIIRIIGDIIRDIITIRTVIITEDIMRLILITVTDEEVIHGLLTPEIMQIHGQTEIIIRLTEEAILRDVILQASEIRIREAVHPEEMV